MTQKIELTFKGWLGFCPIYSTDPDSFQHLIPFVAPRGWFATWFLFSLNEWVKDFYDLILTLMDRNHEPMWTFYGMERLKQPVVLEMGDDDGRHLRY